MSDKERPNPLYVLFLLAMVLMLLFGVWLLVMGLTHARHVEPSWLGELTKAWRAVIHA